MKPCRYAGCSECFKTEDERFTHEKEHKRGKADGVVVDVLALQQRIAELEAELARDRPYVVKIESAEAEANLRRVAELEREATVLDGFIEKRDQQIVTLTAALKTAREALEVLVTVNEEWNAAVESVIGRPSGWNANYLNDAKAALQAIDKVGE